MEFNDLKLAVVGLGYVGLPLAIEFAKHRTVIGFDINKKRIADLNSGFDYTKQAEVVEPRSSKIIFTDNPNLLHESNIFIIAVPTPIDRYKRPDLSSLLLASKTVGSYLKKNDIVIYESTVYPGATEEECVPVLERMSSLKFNVDFFVGYSPERINPGDKLHKISEIKKITSGSNNKVAVLIDNLYKEIIEAGTCLVSSIRIAEAAKVVENIQRDINIALINELAIIFNHMKIDTKSVLEAASTKWNFLPFRPGLVGGHCIGIDPYYLIHKSQAIGYHPEIISAARKINDSMSIFVVSELLKVMIKRQINLFQSKILVMGLTFKENCPDIRNTQVVSIIRKLEEYGVKVEVYDPWADPVDVFSNYGVSLNTNIMYRSYDAILIAVAHECFIKMGSAKIRMFGKQEHVLYDLKCIFTEKESDIRL